MKNVLRLLLTICVLIGLASQTQAQQQPRTTVQLPVFSFFSGATTINIPDRGQALLGSVKRSSTGTVSRGVPILGNLPVIGRPFKNRATGRSQSASTLSATVQIYDLREMDEALLAEARRDRALKERTSNKGKRILNIGGTQRLVDKSAKSAVRQKADFITKNLGRNNFPKR